jgi:hypothetical protein
MICDTGCPSFFLRSALTGTVIPRRPRQSRRALSVAVNFFVRACLLSRLGPFVDYVATREEHL